MFFGDRSAFPRVSPPFPPIWKATEEKGTIGFAVCCCVSRRDAYGHQAGKAHRRRGAPGPRHGLRAAPRITRGPPLRRSVARFRNFKGSNRVNVGSEAVPEASHTAPERGHGSEARPLGRASDPGPRDGDVLC